MYKQRESALNGIGSVKANAVEDKRYERKTANDGQYYFVLIAANGQTIGKSAMYKAESGRDNRIKSVKTHAPDATLNEIS